ncbi:hypothetical protein T12_10250 [Trichinella patagoniensis]|uniref:Uncharacterized protein n=1 Tax=Trichinella patagoniensis TaxID=990121 RepID=A0A0V0ZAA0_9BILA|nr:hypothetical protein T12_10250 [Trichinella patagoniensis]
MILQYDKIRQQLKMLIAHDGEGNRRAFTFQNLIHHQELLKPRNVNPKLTYLQVERVDITYSNDGDSSMIWLTRARDTFAVAYNSSSENTPRPPHNLRALMKSMDVSTRSWKQRFTSLSIAWLYPLADCLMLLNLAIIS